MNRSLRLQRCIRQVLLTGALSAAGVGVATSADSDASEELEEVVVVGRTFNYNSLDSAYKMPVEIVDTPQSVQIITSDMLNFANVQSLNELYKLDSGAQPSYSRAGYSWTYFRGFANSWQNAMKVDGFRQAGSMLQDLAPYERVEVVKGSVSTMYGQSGIAGTINAVTKQPKTEFGGSLTATGGEYGYKRIDGDVYGSLTDDGRLSARMVAAYQDSDSFLVDSYEKRTVVAPSLRYEFSDMTSVTLSGQYQKLESSASVGMPAAYDPNGPGGSSNPANYRIPDVSYDHFGVGPEWSKMDKTLHYGQLRFEHTFENQWQLRAAGTYTDYTAAPLRWIWPGAGSPISTDKTQPQSTYVYYAEEASESWAGEVNLFGDVELFGRNHTLFLGADSFNWNYSFLPFAQAVYFGNNGVNIYSPDFSTLPMPTSLADWRPGGPLANADSTFVTTYKQRERTRGLTGQAFIRPTDALTVMLGVRYSEAEKKEARNCCDYAASAQPPTNYIDMYPSQNATTFQGGLTYSITPDINAYATYGQSFDVRSAFAFNPADPAGPGTFLGPGESETKELGLKGELFGRQVYWSVALFETSRTNITQPDPDNRQYSIEVGKQRSRGVELAFQGEIRPGFDVFISSSAMDNKYVGGQYDGIQSPFGPKFSISAYSSYQFLEGPLRGFGFGGGVVHQNRPVFQLLDGDKYPQLFGDFTTVDARLFYDMPGWRFQLAASNLFSEKFFSPTFIWLGGQIAGNPPRQVLASVTRSF